MADQIDGSQKRCCSVCSRTFSSDSFSKKQWANKAHSRKCKNCVQDSDSTTTTVGASKGAQEGKKNGQGKKPDAGKPPADKMAQMMAELREDAQDDDGEDDPFVCDVTGALIDMKKDGRYHFDDGRTPDDPSAVCMSVSAYKRFDKTRKENPDTWETEYSDKSKWVFIQPE